MAAILGSLFLASHLADSETETSAARIVHPDPTFIVRWTGRELILHGHTLSKSHEAELRQLSISLFPDAQTEFRFEPMGTVPSHWVETTDQSLRLLGVTRSAVAKVSTEELAIRAITPDDVEWRNRLDELRSSLSNRITVTAEALPVDSAMDVSGICEQAFDSLDVGAIQFKESTAAFRTSAYPRLERVAALASTCRNSRLVITGHTDASGNQAMNARLSLERARAVRAFIAKRGIDNERIVTIGAGSAEPVADNRTRYGRSLNRRIEIDLQNN